MSDTQYEPPPLVLPKDSIAVPRRVVFFQALLLVAMCAVGFVCGVLYSRISVGGNQNLTATVSGSVNGSGGNGESNCVVLFLPVAARPQSPLGIAAISRGEFSAQTRDRLRAFGASWSVTDEVGHYHAELPTAGDYFVLALSRSSGSNQDVSQSELAAIGQYFVPAFELVSSRKYVWDRKAFSGDDEWHATLGR